ncbi:MAG: hypothetical protein K2Q26_11910 [Bdellovibrionales bacterium]|nr:hypothetical protein [Bdellovibrionales bacterium]
MEHNVRYPRIERDEEISVHEDENAHLWAVSYSDFLMVLLCFFILFFSLDDQKKNMLLVTLAESFNGKKEHGSDNPGFAKEKTQARLPATFLETLKGLNVSINKDRESLILNFPENLFASGSHIISKENHLLIKDVLTKVYPHRLGLNLYFEGHTDNKPIHRKIQNVVVDNYLLSSLRASTALKEAREMGFPEAQMFIQATSSHSRNSRTLSLRIEPREVVQ